MKSIVSEQHITTLDWASEGEVDDMLAVSKRVNDFLCGQFLALGIRLISFTLEFGRVYFSEIEEDTQVLLIDEISPDTCRLWDIKTGEKLDKERFLENLGQAEQAYQEIARRLGILENGGPPDLRDPLVT